jgi:anti-sigma regulatory factor (Ser/Thr protein kinase)
VGNVVRHARTEMLLAVTLDDEQLTVEVADDSSDLLVRRQPTGAETSGRGLVLVNSLASRGGVRRRDSGKAVWFALASMDGNGAG